MFGDLAFMLGPGRHQAGWYTHRVKDDLDHEGISSSPARLEAVSGPLEGRTFPLTEDEVSIGREPCNQISLLDSLVSRRHCVIRKDGPDFLIQDLDSRNSTFVNSLPVKERVLADGDQIRVGKSILVFQGLPERVSDHRAAVQLDSVATPGGATMVLRKQDAIYLQSSQLRALGTTERTVHDLNVLLNFSKRLNLVHGLAALQQNVLEAVLEISSADRAAILLTEEGTEGFTSVIGLDRKLGPNQPIQVSQTISEPGYRRKSRGALQRRCERRDLSRGGEPAGAPSALGIGGSPRSS